jgi:hypothetical protein
MNLWDFTDQQLGAMSFDDIRQLRRLFPDQASQNRLSPFDRSSYVIDQMRVNGPQAGIIPALGSPVFEALKALPGTNNMGSRSEPSMSNALAGMVGFGQGLNEWNQSKTKTRVKPINPSFNALNTLR